MLRTSVILATLGTVGTAVLTAVAAALILDLEPLPALLLGSTVAATDAAAVFAVLRGSTLRRRIARTLEGESGLNDPIAILLVIGCIEAIQDPSFGIADALAARDPGARDRARRRPRGRARRDPGAQARAAAVGRPVPRRLDRHRRARLRPRRHAARLGLPLRLPRRAGARHRDDPGPPYDRHVPRRRRLDRPARAVPDPRPARVPRGPRGDRARGHRDRRRDRRLRPPAGDVAGHRRAGLHRGGADRARLGRPARRGPGRVRDLRGHGGDRGRADDLQRHVLRRAALDRAPGHDDRPRRPAARRAVGRGRDPRAAGGARAARTGSGRR